MTMNATAAATPLDDRFPLDSLRAAARELRRPFGPMALQWKIQTQWPRDARITGGLIVCYIDRPLVVDRLNVLVPHLWNDEFVDLERDHTLCRLTIDGVTREDVGEGRTLKARRSDALKRAAVHFGVGVSLARIPKSRLQVANGHLDVRSYQTSSGERFAAEITQKGLDYLRDRYGNWLDKVGERTFGPPLDHGDLGDAQGDDDSLDESVTIASAELKVALYQRLTHATTLRQQRGYLVAAGVTDLAPNPTQDAIEHAVSGLTDDEAERLDLLLSATAATGAGDE